MAGLTANGLTILRLPEIVENIQTSERTNISPTINTDEDELLGQLNNIVGASLGDLWALAQAVYDNFNIDKAEGKNLDDLAALRNITRIESSKSSTTRQQFVGLNGTVIEAGSLFSNPITNDRFTNPGEITVSTAACASADLTVKQLENSTEYTITINTSNYTYTSDANATINEILTNFNTQINNDTTATWSSSLTNNVLTISSDNTSPISIVTITFISADSVTTEGTIEAEEFGPIVAPITSVTNVISLIPGLTSTTNAAQLVLGREKETDEELRIRIKTTSGGGCTGTIPSIESSIINNVSGVTSIIITENTTSAVDADNRPSHSYESVIVGGDNTAIAQELWRTKPAGIALFGNTSVVINDSNGNPRTIRFTRAVAKNFAVRVQYTTYAEETFPVGGQDLIRDAVRTHVNGLGINTDVITGRMYGPIYNAAAGINSLTVEIQEITSSGTTPTPANWTENTIAVDSDEFASINNIDITVTDIT